MQIDNVRNNNINFGIKVSPELLYKAQNMYDYKNVPNKRHLIWQFNEKAQKYEKYEHNDYTLGYTAKRIGKDMHHFLIATNDTNPEEKIILAKRGSLHSIISRFLEIKRKDFREIMYNGKKSIKLKQKKHLKLK